MNHTARSSTAASSERIERFRLKPQPEPEQAPKAKPAPRPRIPLQLNRNLMNYPLARDARTRVTWKEQGRYWYAKLAGEERVGLCVPAHTPTEERRLPTAFDINVLFRLLAAVQQTKCDRPVELASLGALLRDLRLTRHKDNYARLASSLAFWSRLSIRFENWYDHAQCGEQISPGYWGPGKPSAHVTRIFPPPIDRVNFVRRRLVVRLSSAWAQLALGPGYRAALPLPLPAAAAAQNLALLALTFDDKICDLRWLCRKIGLRCEGAKLKKTAATVGEWLGKHGGVFWLILGSPDGTVAPGRVRLYIPSGPTIPRWPNAQLDGSENTRRSEGQNTTVEGAESASSRRSKGQNTTVEGSVRGVETRRKQTKLDETANAVPESFALEGRDKKADEADNVFDDVTLEQGGSFAAWERKMGFHSEDAEQQEQTEADTEKEVEASRQERARSWLDLPPGWRRSAQGYFEEVDDDCVEHDGDKSG